MRAGNYLLSAAALLMLLIAAQPARAQGAANLDNATCLGCHGTAGFSVQQFADSVHGKASLRCVDCHTAITELPHKNLPATAAAREQQRLAVNKSCGNCHAKAWRSYTETYHGKVAALGYGDTATCADCHGSHAILPASNPASSVSPGNMLKTCRNCHPDASAGFATFQPHATTDDFAHYPYVWIASKFVIAAVGGVLVIFWIHSGRRAAARRGPLRPTLESGLALGASHLRAQHHRVGGDRRDLALSDHGLGAAARTRAGRAENRQPAA